MKTETINPAKKLFVVFLITLNYEQKRHTVIAKME